MTISNSFETVRSPSAPQYTRANVIDLADYGDISSVFSKAEISMTRSGDYYFAFCRTDSDMAGGSIINRQYARTWSGQHLMKHLDPLGINLHPAKAESLLSAMRQLTAAQSDLNPWHM